MSRYLVRNPNNPGASNTARPGDSTFQFYEASYTTGTTQEWIYLPDAIFPIGVTLSISSGIASLDVTDSPPDVIEAGNASTTTWPVGSVTTSISTTLTGYTAFRVNRSSGTIKISVRA